MMTAIKEVLKICRKYDCFLVASHHNPDADAAGSSLAMALFLKSLGKKAIVLNEDGLPEWLQFLPSAKLLKKASDIKAPDYDAAVILDCGELKRVGSVQNFLAPGKPVVNIDHHHTNDRFGTVRLINGKASSTCEMLFDLFKAAGCRLDRPLATLLYAGLMTDTGSFRFENTSARTHLIAGELMAFGLNADALYQSLYVGIPVVDLKPFVDLVHGAELLLNNKVYCVTLSKKTQDRFSGRFDLKERLFGFLRTVDGIEVVVILTEMEANATRVNLRSQGAFDVARLALKFDGGGHKKAAGAKIAADLNVSKKRIAAAIAAQLKGR